MRIVPKMFTNIPMKEFVPRTGLNLLRYKRRLRWMAEEVCPPNKTWQVALLAVAVAALWVVALVKWWCV